MTDTLVHRAPLARWQGEKAVYHLLRITGEAAEALAAHALMQRLEFGRQRGFGSIKVMALIGETQWKTSVFPQKKPSPSSGEAVGRREREWILLVSKKVMRAEDIAPGDEITAELTLL